MPNPKLRRSRYWRNISSSHTCRGGKKDWFILVSYIVAAVGESEGKEHTDPPLSFSFRNNGNILVTKKNAEILRPFRREQRWKVLPPSGVCVDCTSTGGLKNASSLAVITLEIAFFLPFHWSGFTYHTWRNLLIQSSPSDCGFCYQTATSFPDSRKPIAAFGLPHSHPGPHWSASEHPLYPPPSSGCHWWRPAWGPPADLHSGSRPRRPPGCPGPWTWCRRRQIPGLWCEAACWLDRTAQTVAPRGAACLMRCHYGAPTHVPSIQPWHAGGYLIMEEREKGAEGWKEGVTM